MDKDSAFDGRSDESTLPPEIANAIKEGNFTMLQKRYLHKIPWGKTKPPEIDMIFAKETLEASHYGMQSVKDQILRYIACQKHLGHSYGDVLLLVGPPGVGKTSISKSIAKAMNREFYKISLAGMSDAGPLRGYDTNYQSPKPGQIVQGIIKTGSFSPLILLDEIDKMGSSSSNGDPAYVLLDILDSDRTNFVDDMVELPIDLSNIVFVATANSIKEMSPILLNRLEVINLKGYTREDKIKIANEYIIPSLKTEYQIDSFGIEFTNNLIEYLIDNHSHEPGIRSLRRSLKLVIESVITQFYLGHPVAPTINIAEYNRLTRSQEITENPYRKKSSYKKKIHIEYNLE
ncbi:MAG: AAA family ATPase [Oscillospiraceae bacterium]|nr:AAA family ATPase [Oscillospiraceae bacterium]